MAEKVADPSKADLRASIVAEMEAHASKEPEADAEPQGEVDETAEPEAKEDAEPAEEVAAEPAAEVAAPAAPPDKTVAQGFAALSKREADSRAAHQARFTELKQYEQQLVQRTQQIEADLRTKIEAEYRSEAVRDPVGFYTRRLKVEKGFKDIAAPLYYHELGDAAPADIKEKRHVYGVAAQVEAIRADFEAKFQKLEQERQQADNERRYADYRAGLVAELPKLPREANYLRALAQTEPQRAADLMMMAANDYVRTHPDEAPPKADVLIKAVEQHLQNSLRPFLGTKTKSPAAEETEPASTPTLTNEHEGRTRARVAPKSREERKADLIAELERHEGRSE